MKPSDPKSTSSGEQMSDGRVVNGGGAVAQYQLLPSGIFQAHNTTLAALLSLAYGKREEEIFGMPDWFRTSRFDVSARGPANTSREDLGPMLQVLLERNFKMTVHTEPRQTSAFVLERGKGEIRLRAPSTGEYNCKGVPNVPEHTQEITCTNMTMARFAAVLPRMARSYVDKTALDETGIGGSWDFDLVYSDRATTNESGGPTIFTAIGKLGLRLAERKTALPVLVVDHAEPLQVQ